MNNRGNAVDLSVYSINGCRKYLNSSEVSSFIRATIDQDMDVRAFCWMMAYTGCRISEALAITAGAVDFDAEAVLIRSLKKREKTVFRSIPLPRSLLQLLKRLIERRELRPDEQLWPWCRMTGYRHICRAMHAAGLWGAHVSPKGLRHGFAVQAMQASIPLTVLQRWLGHADVKTTAIYATVTGPEERAMARKLWRSRETNAAKTKLSPHTRFPDSAMSDPTGLDDRGLLHPSLTETAAWLRCPNCGYH